MPMMIVCDKLAYLPGQLITGHVVIISKSPQKVKGLTMRFIGRSSKLMGVVEGTKRYKKEVYFDEKTDIFGHDGSNTQLRVGETLYPFTFPLPPGLPASFEWPDGNVLYFVEAKLTRASWKDKRVSTRVQVDGVYDLNLEPSVVTPIEVKRQKYVKHLLTKSGPYGFTFKCNRSGFVKGYSLPFSVEIRNLSKVDSRKLRVSLLQEVKNESGKPVATLVEQMKGPPVTAGEVVTWEARLKIPVGIPPSNLGNVLSYPVVINVFYFLHIQLSLKNCREEPICIKIPITIGTIAYNRRALSVPSLDDGSYLPYTSNGHRVDCPMSQLILPSAAISTSQFSPHLVSVNTATSYTHTHVTRGHSLLPHTLSSTRNPPAPVQILGPVRQYEYYFEYEDANGSTRSVASRGDSLFQRRRTQSNAGNGRRRCIVSTSVTESPPPSYHEIFTRERSTEASENVANSNVTNNMHNNHQRSIHNPTSTGGEAIHKTVLSPQLSSTSSDEEDDDEENPTLHLPSSVNDASGRSSSSGSDRNSSVNSESEDEEEEDDDDDDACSSVSANEEFLSCSGSSSSFEEFKCHELQSARRNELQLLEASREEDTELSSGDNHNQPSSLRRNNNNRPCPCGKRCSNVQGGCKANIDVYRQQHLWALSNSDDDGCRRNANNSTMIGLSHNGDS